MKIGVFDSGFGGLNVFRYISDNLKDSDLVYLGDTARAPYGDRSQETIYEYTKQGIEFLFSKGCMLVVLACNTASSEALRKIQQEFLPVKYPDRNVLGVLIPIAEEVSNITKNNKVGVLATESTIASGAYVREIQKINGEIELYGQPAPLLVPIVEFGETNKEVVDSVISEYLDPLISKDVDTIILGCTHYGIIKENIKNILGDKNIKLISGEEIIAQKLKKYIGEHTEYESGGNNGLRKFYTTGLSDKFNDFGSKIFGSKIQGVKVFLE